MGGGDGGEHCIFRGVLGHSGRNWGRTGATVLRWPLYNTAVGARRLFLQQGLVGPCSAFARFLGLGLAVPVPYLR